MSISSSPSFSTVSSRAQRLASTPCLPYIEALLRHTRKKTERQTEGETEILIEREAVLLAVAENKLCAEELVLPRLSLALSLSPAPQYTLNYTSCAGLPGLRDSLASFLKEYVFSRHTYSDTHSDAVSESQSDGHHDSGNRPVFEVNPDHLVVGAGCVALLVSLSMLLFEPGDALLTPVPYYPAFDKDFLNFGDAVVLPVHGDHISEALPFGELTVAALNAALVEAAPRRVKALLLSNPNNPMGTIYSRDELLAAVTWCREHRMHLIMDEIYALSLFSINQGGQQKFVSIVEILNNDLGDYVHFLWSFSKDFSASGFRVGVLYTQNKSLLAAISATNDAMMASNITQFVMQSLIEDRSFVDLYLRENSKRLYKSYSLLKDTFAEWDIKVIPAEGAIFAFCDFRQHLTEPTFEEERRLFSKLDENGVLFTPGECCHCPYPGFFRVCYAFVSFDDLQEGLRRVHKVLFDGK